MGLAPQNEYPRLTHVPPPPSLALVPSSTPRSGPRPRATHFPDEWRKNKRYIEYAQVKPLSDYNYETIPGASPPPPTSTPCPIPAELSWSPPPSSPDTVQWSSWLRRTRRDPPTLQELETDLQRQLRLRDNVARLEQAYRDEKLRLAGRAESARMVAAPRSQGEGADADADAEAGRATASVAGKEVDGLPLEDGGVDAPAGKHASVVARELDGVKHASPSRAPAPAPAPSASGSPRAAAPQAEGLPLRDGGVNPQAGKRAPVVARELREGAQRVEPNVGGAEGAQAVSAEEAARRRRDEEHAAALRRREEFGASPIHLFRALFPGYDRADSRVWCRMRAPQPSRTRRR